MHRSGTYLLFVLLASIFISFSPQEQSKGRIHGRVLDDSTHAPISGANVFLASSTLGTSTDTSGNFVIKNVPPGSYELVASCVGYKMSATKVRVSSSEDQEVNVQLKPVELRMEVVEVTAARDEAWKENLKLFTKYFLGTTPVTSKCRIVNPEELRFSTGAFSRLEATADKEIVIENSFLGYRMTVLLDYFVREERWVRTMCKVRYEELKPPDAGAASDWIDNRDEVYYGSLRHFLRSLINDELSRDGFMVYNVASLGYLNTDMLPYELGRNDILKQSKPNEWAVEFQKYLVIAYDRKQVDAGRDQYNQFGIRSAARSTEGRLTRPFLGILSLTEETLQVDAQGQILNRLGVRIMGDWAMAGLANDLPLDFRPKGKR